MEQLYLLDPLGPMVNGEAVSYSYGKTWFNSPLGSMIPLYQSLMGLQGLNLMVLRGLNLMVQKGLMKP